MPPRRLTNHEHRLILAGLVLTAVTVVVAACSRTPEPSDEAFCQHIRSVQDIDEVLAGGSPTRTGDELSKLRQLETVAPGDLGPHVARLVQVTDELAQAFADTRDPDLATRQVFARHQGDVPAITESGKAVDRFSRERCQLALDGGEPTAAPPAPASSSSSTTTTPPSSTTTTTTTGARSKTRPTTAPRPSSTTTRRSGATRPISPTTSRRTTVTTLRSTPVTSAQQITGG